MKHKVWTDFYSKMIVLLKTEVADLNGSARAEHFGKQKPPPTVTQEVFRWTQRSSRPQNKWPMSLTNTDLHAKHFPLDVCLLNDTTLLIITSQHRFVPPGFFLFSLIMLLSVKVFVFGCSEMNVMLWMEMAGSVFLNSMLLFLETEGQQKIYIYKRLQWK